MKEITFGNGEVSLTRVTKKIALKEFMKGKKIVVVPYKMRPFSVWQMKMILCRKDLEGYCLDEIGIKNMFNDRVASFSYYNCNNETGRYPSFYVEGVFAA